MLRNAASSVRSVVRRPRISASAAAIDSCFDVNTIVVREASWTMHAHVASKCEFVRTLMLSAKLLRVLRYLAFPG